MDQLTLPGSSSQRVNRKNQQSNRRTGRWERVEQRMGNIPPCQRSLHTAACWKDNMLVFGGYDGHVRLNDLHCYNFTSNKWTILNSYQAPSPRDRHSAVIFENYLVIFGGFDGVSRVDDLHVFDLESMQWESIEEFTGTPPTARHSHSAVRWQDCLYIFGGYDGSYRSDFHEFNFTQSKWTQINASGDIPRARYRGTCVVYENSMILHGGHDGSRHLQDTHIFDFMTKTWHALETTGPIPSPRDSHVAVVYKKSMFIYGGSTGSAVGDFHELKVAERTWQSVETITSTIGNQNTNTQQQSRRNIDGMTSTEGHHQNTILNIVSSQQHQQQPFVFGGSLSSSSSSSSSSLSQNQLQTHQQYTFANSPNRLLQQHAIRPHIIMQSQSTPDIISAEGNHHHTGSLFSNNNPFVRSHSPPPVLPDHNHNHQQMQQSLDGSVFGPRSPNANISRYNNMSNNPFHRHSIHNDTAAAAAVAVGIASGGNEIPHHHNPNTNGSSNSSHNQLQQQQLASTSIFYYNSPPTSAVVTSTSITGGGGANTSGTGTSARAGSRFCHVGVVYDDSLFVFGGYDGQTRLNDFVRFRFESVEDDLPPSTLLSDLRELVDNELLSDVTFIVDGIPVRAHKVLCLRCPYFRNLLTGEYMESRANEIVIPDVRHTIFLQFLQFVYCDHVDVTTECAMELFQTADRFGFERLKKITEKVMLLALSIETAGQILLAADMHNASHLRERCMNFIVNSFDEVSKTAGFEEMARGDVDLLFEILRRR